MFSEVFRRSTLTMLITLAILIGLTIISQFLVSLYMMTEGSLYFYISRCIPTLGANYFPSLLMRKLMTIPNIAFLGMINDPLIAFEAMKRSFSQAILVNEALRQAAIFVAIYAIIFILVAVYRLLKSDVAKKTA